MQLACPAHNVGETTGHQPWGCPVRSFCETHLGGCLFKDPLVGRAQWAPQMWPVAQLAHAIGTPHAPMLPDLPDTSSSLSDLWPCAEARALARVAKPRACPEAGPALRRRWRQPRLALGTD